MGCFAARPRGVDAGHENESPDAILGALDGQLGGVAKSGRNALDSKSSCRRKNPARGFESHPLRSPFSLSRCNETRCQYRISRCIQLQPQYQTRTHGYQRSRSGPAGAWSCRTPGRDENPSDHPAAGWSRRWPSRLPTRYRHLRNLEHQHPELTRGLCDVLPRKVLARLPSFPHPWPEDLAAELTPELVAEALLQLVPHVGDDTSAASRFFQTIRDSRGHWNKEVSWHRGLVILPPLAAAHWLHQLVLGAPLQDARGHVRHLVIDYDGPRHLCDPETRHEALCEIRTAGVPVWFATRPSCNREHSMHVYVLLDQPMPAEAAAEHVRRLLRAKPGGSSDVRAPVHRARAPPGRRAPPAVPPPPPPRRARPSSVRAYTRTDCTHAPLLGVQL